ncbi:MAG: pectate lyase [Lachnoclostridium sp.]|nr:pectate lyase [Lachnoclostridium sp.]
MKRSFFLFAALLMLALAAKAEVKIKAAEGWLETAWVEWYALPDITSYNVYVSLSGADSWTKLDDELVRGYGGYGRADALGLKADTYSLKVVPVRNGVELADEATVADNLVVKAHDRSGYAHFGRDTEGLHEGVGAYRNDGTLKDDAIVLYVSAKNAKTITVTWPYTATSQKTYTGLYGMIEGYRKCVYQGGLKRPLCIRMIGTITADDMDKLRFGQGLDIKGEKEYSELPLTFEGVGNDATIYGFGVQFSQVTGAEMRNIGIMLCKDDGVELNKHNSHIWLHNIDVFYGQVGSDADQVKGDGAIDIKYSSYCTVAYNHFFDNGKCCLIDPSKSYGSETPADYLTYHHNWFDHADSRLPRCRHGKAFHVYNNYYDGNGEYGVGLASNACAFVENNYFRNCRYPIINSGQGTDKGLVDSKQSKKGLLSGEDGGVCKFWNNHVEGAKSFITQKDQYGANLYDAYLVDSRDEVIPETVKALKAETVKTPTTYSNFDTTPGMIYDSYPDDPEEIPELLTGTYGSGRCQKGDFKWEFDNTTEDSNTDVITALKTALTNYKSSLTGTFDASMTGIGEINLRPESAEPCYDILGRHVAPSTKGLIITPSGKHLNR